MSQDSSEKKCKKNSKMELARTVVTIVGVIGRLRIVPIEIIIIVWESKGQDEVRFGFLAVDLPLKDVVGALTVIVSVATASVYTSS
jgi:hypothetical protein